MVVLNRRSMMERPTTTTFDATAVDTMVGELLTLVARERASHLQRWCRQDLSMASLHLLLALQAAGPLPMSRVAEILDTAGSNLTGLVTRLEERGLVQRTHDQEDRRLVYVSLTDGGRQLAEDREFMPARHLHQVLEALPESERAALVASMRVFLQTSERLRAEGRLLEDDADLQPTL